MTWINVRDFPYSNNFCRRIHCRCYYYYYYYYYYYHHYHQHHHHHNILKTASILNMYVCSFPISNIDSETAERESSPLAKCDG